MTAPQTWQLVALNNPGPLWFALLVVVALGALLWTWRSLDPGMPLRVRLLITALRALVLGLATVLLLQPALRRRQTVPQPGNLAVLIDISPSMREAGSPPRLERALSLLAQHRDALTAQHPQYFLFHTDTTPVTQPPAPADIPPPKDGTDIAQAIALATADPDITAILLLSDGADTTGTAPEHIAKTARVPVNTLLLAHDDAKADIAIAHVRVDPFAFTRTPTPVQVELTSQGFQGAQTSVSLLEDGVVLQTRDVAFEDGRARAEFSVFPPKPGPWVLTAQVPVSPDDTRPDNNTQHIAIQVVRDRYRVLHLSGLPSWDQRFLRDAFTAWPRVDLVSFYVLRNRLQATSQGTSGLSLIPFPTRELFEQHLHEFDVLFFHDFDPQEVGIDTWMPQIKQFVQHGGALVVLGGPNGLNAPALVSSAFADVLPLQMPPADAPPERLFDARPFRPAPTPAAKHHPLTRPGLQRGGIWHTAPTLEGIAMAQATHPEAQVLLAHPFARTSDGPAPLLAVLAVERGRTMMLATDSLWLTRFAIPMDGGPAGAFADFWKNAVAWLTQDPEMNPLQLSVAPDPQSDVHAVAISVSLRNAQWQPDPRAPLTIDISWRDDAQEPQQQQLSAHTDNNGQLSMRWLPQASGPHEIAVSAANGRSNTTRFISELGMVERQHRSPRPAFLQRLAERTGGIAFDDDLNVDRLAQHNRAGVRDQITDVPLWSHPALFAALFLLLLLEWYLRRRSGID